MPKKEANRVIKGSLRPWYRWHRRVGITAAVLVVIISITGLILNHNTSLGLHKDFITSKWLLEWYGYDPNAKYSGEVLTVDQIILDIHTGRFFGSFGTYVMDAAAIAFIILAGSGVYMWYRRLPASKQKRKRNKK